MSPKAVHAAISCWRLNRAFRAAERKLRHQDSPMAVLEVEDHAPLLHGETTLLERELGHGYLRANDWREVLFSARQA